MALRTIINDVLATYCQANKLTSSDIGACKREYNNAQRQLRISYSRYVKIMHGCLKSLAIQSITANDGGEAKYESPGAAAFYKAVSFSLETRHFLS
eukprot:scaffold195622_cov28-Prasinocladus_malaysianus.AAC.1